MNYFSNIPKLYYRFGDQSTTNAFPDLTSYVQVVDDIKNNVAFYNPYYIKEGYRPDQLSQNIYGTPVYHWTFFMMNDKLRERGWPLGLDALYTRVKDEYPHMSLITTDDITGKFKIGQTVIGTISGATGIIRHRKLHFGQILIDVTSSTPFRFQETVRSTINVPGGTEVQTAYFDVTEEYNSVSYYKGPDGRRKDVDPLIGPGAQDTIVTIFDHLTEMNEDLRTITIIKPSVISQVVSSIKQALSS